MVRRYVFARRASQPALGLPLRRSRASPVPAITNETIFSLTELPRRIAVLGAGPIGCELSQTLRRFGAEVTLLERGPHILPREDEEAARIVEHAILRDGARLLTEAGSKVQRRGAEKVLTIYQGGRQVELVVNEILVGAGRVPNVTGLGLESAGVEYDEVEA